MKNRLTVLSLIALILVATMVSLGANGCGTKSDGIGTLYDIHLHHGDTSYLGIVVQPTSAAQANHTYVVDLYEKGKLRDSATVSWNQPEINVQDTKEVQFVLTGQEFDAYLFHESYELEKIFSIKVH